MLSRLSPEAAKLFELLAARDWRDEELNMSRFVKVLVADRDSQRALGVMKTLTNNWSGLVSKKGLLGFFANRFTANDIQEAPGGYTMFMFSPLSAPRSKDRKKRQQQVRSMFGSTELDDDAVKYYAENDFYLADTLEGLEEQIYTCIMCLEKLTELDGIVSEGYWHGLNMLQRNKRVFLGLLGMDPLFPVRFAYLLDLVLQNFVEKLGDFFEDERPIRRACLLRGSQVKANERSMTGYKTGSISMLFLPSSLKGVAVIEGSNRESTEQGRSQKSKKRDSSSQDQETPKPWWTKNPNIVSISKP
jgi:hypothetical protein